MDAELDREGTKKSWKRLSHGSNIGEGNGLVLARDERRSPSGRWPEHEIQLKGLRKTWVLLFYVSFRKGKSIVFYACIIMYGPIFSDILVPRQRHAVSTSHLTPLAIKTFQQARLVAILNQFIILASLLVTYAHKNPQTDASQQLQLNSFAISAKQFGLVCCFKQASRTTWKFGRQPPTAEVRKQGSAF